MAPWISKPSFFAKPFIRPDICCQRLHLQVDGSAEVLASVDSVGTQLLLNTEDLVQLGQTLGTSRGTGLDLAGAQADGDISNGDILSLTGAVGDHDTPAIGVGVLGGLDRLGQGTNLVDLKQKSVAGLELDGLLDAQRVGDSQIITDNLEVGGLVEVAPGLPVVLGERILDGNNGVLGSEGLVEVGKLLVGEPLGRVALGVLEVKIVLLSIDLVELAGGNVHGDLHLASVTGLLDGLGDEVQSLLGSLNIRGDTTLVTDVASGLAVLLLGESLELVVDLGTLAESLREGGSSAIVSSVPLLQRISKQQDLRGNNHELLEGKTATGVGATVQDVLEGDGQDEGLLGSGKVGDVSVEGNTLLSGGSLGNGQGDTEDGISTELALVGGSIELVQELVNLGLVLDIDVLLDEGGANDVVDVLDGTEDT
jgi:hypothetical protein